MFAATAYDVLKHWQAFSMADVPVFGVGFVAAFLSAFLAVRLLRFVATHTFVVFCLVSDCVWPADFAELENGLGELDGVMARAVLLQRNKTLDSLNSPCV